MIDHALLHLPGIGPARARVLRSAGIHTWDALARSLPAGAAGRRLKACIERDQRALAREDIAHFTATLARQDLWRVLDVWFERATFFDIETTGAGLGDAVTVIGCLHRGSVRLFVRHENLEAFLDLLEEVDLLVSFNGAAFDVPRILETFHVPCLPCPHLDLRWVCHHGGLRGGLKRIEHALGIERPPDLAGVDGEQAVTLWRLWAEDGHVPARRQLLRYCAADVLTLPRVAAAVLRASGGACAAPCGDTLALLPGEDAFPPPPPRLRQGLPEAAGDADQAPGDQGASLDRALHQRLRRHWRRQRGL